MGIYLWDPMGSYSQRKRLPFNGNSSKVFLGILTIAISSYRENSDKLD